MLTVHPVLWADRYDYQDSLEEMYRQRYQVFVDILGWDIPGVDHGSRREIDDFDRDYTDYLLIMRDRELVGASRMIPTTKPNMMSTVFSDLCSDGPPNDHLTWEWSRGHVKPDEPHGVRSAVLDHIFAGGYEFAHRMGIKRLTAQINADELPRWLSRGLYVTTLGDPIRQEDGCEVLAIMHTINSRTLGMVRQQTGLASVLLPFNKSCQRNA